jgi:hypothetical protein
MVLARLDRAGEAVEIDHRPETAVQGGRLQGGRAAERVPGDRDPVDVEPTG